MKQSDEMAMKIRIVTGDEIIEATLDDNAAARELARRLPVDLTLRDYHATEKIADLPKPLPTEGSPEGYDPEVGDIAYYAPWGNLAFYYRDFGYSHGLVRLGRIDGGLNVLATHDELPVRIDIVE